MKKTARCRRPTVLFITEKGPDLLFIRSIYRLLAQRAWRNYVLSRAVSAVSTRPLRLYCLGRGRLCRRCRLLSRSRPGTVSGCAVVGCVGAVVVGVSAPPEGNVSPSEDANGALSGSRLIRGRYHHSRSIAPDCGRLAAVRAVMEEFVAYHDAVLLRDHVRHPAASLCLRLHNLLLSRLKRLVFFIDRCRSIPTQPSSWRSWRA